MNINDFLEDEEETVEEKNIKEYRRNLFELMNNGALNTLQFSYFKKFSETGGSLCNISWYLDMVNDIGNKESIKFKQSSAKTFKNLFAYKDDEFRLNKNILFKSTRIDTIDFTEEQKKAVKKLINFVQDKDKKTFGLYGFAGSGKTTTVVEFVSYLIRNRFIKTIAFTAPTNKAVNVIKSKFKSHLKKIVEDMFDKKLGDHFNFDEELDFLDDQGIRISFITIHKLLNFQTDFSVTGETIFIRDTKNGSLISDYELCIVDECSMISMDMIDSIFDEVRGINQRKGDNFQKCPKIIFTGDPAQLPPVNEEDSSIFTTKDNSLSFGEYMRIMNFSVNQYVISDAESQIKFRYDILVNDLQQMETFLLKKVVRSKIDNVTQICYEIRKWVNKTDGLPDLEQYMDLEGVHFYEYQSGDSKTKTLWFKNFLDLTKKGVSTIILTWTNRQTDQYNETIRRMIFKKKDIKKYEVGDILMLGDFYNLDLGEQLVKQRLYTSEQIKVLKAKIEPIPINKFEVFTSSTLKRIKNYGKIEDQLKMLIFALNKQFCNNIKLKCWVLAVHKLGENNQDTMTIITVDDVDQDRYQRLKDGASNLINGFSRQILNAYKSAPKQVEKYLIKPLWKQWHYIFNEPFAKINYGYSITCHKAQGSNFFDVFVDIDDVLKNNKIKEAKKCVYTAVTRTSNHLYMLI